MPGLFKLKRSSQWWFRIVVPVRHRAALGKTEIKETLGTSDVNVARVRHAAKLAEVRAMFAGLEQQEAASVDDRADKIIAMGFDALARSNARFHSEMDGFDVARGFDNVCYFMLQMISFRTRLDWGGDYAAQAQREELGKVDIYLFPMTHPVVIDAFSTFAHRDATIESIAVFESSVAYQGELSGRWPARTWRRTTGMRSLSRRRSWRRTQARRLSRKVGCSMRSPTASCAVLSIIGSITGRPAPTR